MSRIFLNIRRAKWMAFHKPRWLNWENFCFAVALFVMLLFAYTAVSKLVDYDKFVFQMQLAPLPLMQTVAPYLGLIVPLVELVIAVVLFFEKTRYFALNAALLLMVSFEVYIVLMKSTGLDLPCTCGGIVSRMSWSEHVVFNGGVILLLAVAVCFYTKADNTY